MRSIVISLRTLAGLLSVFIAAATASSQQKGEAVTDDYLVVGEWQGKTPGTNVQLNISLFNDGTYVRRLVVVNEFAWTAEPHALNIAALSRQGDSVAYGKAMSMKMTLTDSSLVTSFEGDSIRLHRVYTDAVHSSLIGRWQGQTAAGEELIEQFFEDGQMVVLVTLSRDTGRYSASKGSIEWIQQIPKQRKYREKYQADENRLKLFVDVGSRPVELTRAPDQFGSS